MRTTPAKSEDILGACAERWFDWFYDEKRDELEAKSRVPMEVCECPPLEVYRHGLGDIHE